MHLLITRPRHQAIGTAARLRQHGHTVSIEPMLTVNQLNTPLPKSKFDAIILTSANGLVALSDQWPFSQRETVPVLTTGRSTSLAAIELGFAKCSSANGSALDLLHSIPQWMNEHNLQQSARILYPCAKTVAHDLTEHLLTRSISCTSWPTYQTHTATTLPAATVDGLKTGAYHGVLLYSAKTAGTFAALLRQYDVPFAGLTTYVLSKEIFDVLPDALRGNCHYPNRPDEPALFSLLKS